MKLISDKYIDIKLENDFQYKKGLQNYEIGEFLDNKAITYYDLFLNKYSLFTKLTEFKLPVSGALKLFYEEIYKNFKVPTLYKPIASSFIPDYSIVKDLEEYILDKRSILLFNWGINVSEALLYLFTENNIINKVNMHIYHLFCTFSTSNVERLMSYFNKLKKNFEGEHLFINNDPEEVPTKDYDKIVDKYKKENIDLVYFDYRLTKQSLPKLHLACSLIGLLTLKKGGLFIFRDAFSSVYLKHILTLLAKCFEKILIHHEIVKTVRRYVVVCINYKGVDDEDVVTLKGILKSWDKVVKDCGITNKGSVTKLFKKTDPSIDKHVDGYIQSTLRYYNKIVNIYKENMEGVNNLSFDSLKRYYHEHIKITYRKHIAYAKQYDLKLSTEFYEKSPNYVEEVNSIYVLKSPNTYTYLSDFKVRPVVLNKSKIHFDILGDIKQELTLYKVGIDTRNAKKWGTVTYDLNITQGLIYHFKNKYGAKLTRAFFKMYEILKTFKLIKTDTKQIKTFHLCEAPGHFINATHYFVKTEFSQKELDWHANSLNPFNKKMIEKYGTLFSDQYGFIKRFPKRWLWGADDTGDITNRVNIEYFKDKFGNKIDLVTSDCGLGAQTRYEYHSQEEWMGKINFCQILIGLIMNKVGGSAVFKYFMPFNKAISVSLIYLLVQHYESVNIFKPLMTSPTNNEVYIVAQNKLKDISKDDYQNMLKFLEDFDIDRSLYNKISKKFLKNTYYISKGVVERQIDNLKVMYYYYDNEYDKKEVHKLKEKFADRWISKYGLEYDKTSLL